ncbi:PPOX class F420-dependent oxidoreductase [Rubrobacter aplysinae]|uniref:PPOX class F420-dependent oxidoreductase n=1 Tax=Rubrobacter aplysinae TaxID=909625 RepID=UPI00064C0D72|nr:PPOX class F420-dependent oxidoreductase [Rubrobacter aplysinae]
MSDDDRSDPQALHALEGHKYVRLTTYRRDGREVATPVWFAFPDNAATGDRAYVVTGLDSGKVKRIRAGSPVDLTPSDWRGRPLRDAGTVRAGARLLSDEESGAAEAALSKKYGYQYRAFEFVEGRMSRNPSERVFLELTPQGAPG